MAQMKGGLSSSEPEATQDGTVNLFRRNNDIVSPFGSYCCEIPDSGGTDQTLCANLSK